MQVKYEKFIAFFGDDPSNFSLNCYEEFEKYEAEKVLEFGCGSHKNCIPQAR